MKEFYYLEVNIICVIFLFFINHKIVVNKKSSLSERFFRVSVFSAELMCICDAIIGVIDGKIFPFSIFLNHFLNIGYFITGTYVAVGWLFFVSTKVCNRLTKRFMIFTSIPFIIVVLLMITNPFTNLGFVITDENVYIRGPLLFFQWIAVLFYIFYATWLSINAARKENNKVIKNMLFSYTYFGIFPLVAFILQIVIPGITAITVGVALGFLFHYIKNLESQISEDSLTGLNNRKQLEKYISNLIYRNPDAEVFVMMMDLNGFKAINDTYGHTTGDLALKDFAEALRRACRKWRGHYMLCRFGGDEFAVVGEVLPESDLQVFIDLIRENVTEITVMKNREYSLRTSIGIVTGFCKKTEDFTHLYKEADKRMYEDKQRQKAVRIN